MQRLVNVLEHLVEFKGYTVKRSNLKQSFIEECLYAVTSPHKFIANKRLVNNLIFACHSKFRLLRIKITFLVLELSFNSLTKAI